MCGKLRSVDRLCEAGQCNAAAIENKVYHAREDLTMCDQIEETTGMLFLLALMRLVDERWPRLSKDTTVSNRKLVVGVTSFHCDWLSVEAWKRRHASVLFTSAVANLRWR